MMLMFPSKSLSDNVQVLAAGIVILILFMLVFIVFMLVNLKSELKNHASKNDVAELKKELKKDVRELKFCQNWTMKMLPERVDFWHSRTRSDPAPTKRPYDLVKRAQEYYECGSEPKCAFTGLTGDVVLAHLLRRNNPDLAFSHFGLNAEIARDGMRNVMFLCKGLEEAFDAKRISFFQKENKKTGEYEYHMRIWDDGVRNKRVNKKSPLTIEKIEKNVLKFPNEEKIPYSRILSYHHRVCYYHARKSNWIKKKEKSPSQYGSPFIGVPREIDINAEVDSHFSDQLSSMSTPSPGIVFTSTNSTGDTTST